MRILTHKDSKILFTGSYHHHYNQRRRDKAIMIGDRMMLIGLGVSSKHKALARRLSLEMKAGIRQHKIKIKDFDFFGYEASKHRFGFVVNITTPEHNHDMSELIDGPGTCYQVKVTDAQAKRIMDSTAGADGQTVDWVVYRPQGKDTLVYNESPLNRTIDYTDAWDDANRAQPKVGEPETFCITGAPLSGKHTLQNILAGYGYRRGVPEWNIEPVDCISNELPKTWASCVMTRHQALKLKKEFKKRVVILNCVMPRQHWWVLVHRLMKRGKSRDEARRIIDRYQAGAKQAKVDDDYDSVDNLGIQIVTNNYKNEYYTLRLGFDKLMYE